LSIVTLATVTYDPASLTSATNSLDSIIDTLVDAQNAGPGPGPGPGPDPESGVIWVGGADPTINGTAGNDTFKVLTGGLTADVIIDGKGGTDTLSATIRGDGAVRPELKSVEKVILTVQEGTPGPGYLGGVGSGFTALAGGATDNNIFNYATFDAGLSLDTVWWESNNSRADLTVEDVRKNSKETTIVFRESDPGHVDYAVYFDQQALRNQTEVSGSLRAALYDSVGAANENKPLLDNPYNKIVFSVDNTGPHEVIFDVVNGAATFSDLRDAIQAAINAKSELAAYNITVTLVENVSYFVPSDTAATAVDAGYYLLIQSAGHTETT